MSFSSDYFGALCLMFSQGRKVRSEFSSIWNFVLVDLTRIVLAWNSKLRGHYWLDILVPSLVRIFKLGCFLKANKLVVDSEATFLFALR